MWTIRCTRCHQVATYQPTQWHCPCGGPWEPLRPLPFDHQAIHPRKPGIWRYAALWPFQRDPITLGEGWTPLIPLSSTDPRLWAKLDYVMPTGSYKDRGTATGLSALRELGAHHVMDDSSGNAGASLAAYAARAGLQATLFVPAHASHGKKAQMRAMGARLIEVPGPRAQATTALLKALETDGTYASHVYNPFVLLGLAAAAWEIWEQLGYAPDAVITPLGHGKPLATSTASPGSTASKLQHAHRWPKPSPWAWRHQPLSRKAQQLPKVSASQPPRAALRSSRPPGPPEARSWPSRTRRSSRHKTS